MANAAPTVTSHKPGLPCEAKQAPIGITPRRCTGVLARFSHSSLIHNSKMVLPIVNLGPPEEARTPRKDRCGKVHRAPSHISKTVPPTIHLGPPARHRNPRRLPHAEGEPPECPDA